MKTSKRKREAASAAAEGAPPAAPLIVLPANCTLRETAELKTSLMRWLDTADVVKLDASALQRIDTAALQVLCAFVRDRQSRNLPFSWEGGAAALSDATRLLGVTALLGLQEQPAQAHT
ncbi:MAG TPA: STAS domain-containing protein [Steroidobacteraceae bacterium]|nr:STAS domain-containing protein [Steroidobacteraceae bacterium]